MLKIAVLAPIPIANEITAAAVKAGAVAKERIARRTSFRRILTLSGLASLINVLQWVKTVQLETGMHEVAGRSRRRFWAFHHDRSRCFLRTIIS